MPSYRYVQRYRPRDGSRLPHVSVFLRQSCEAIHAPSLFDDAGRQVDFAESSIEALYATRLGKMRHPECGVDFDLFTDLKDTEDVSRFEFHVGTAPGEPFLDFFALQLAQTARPISADVVAGLVEIDEPVEAFLGENNNEFDREAKRRQNQIRDFSRPALIRGIHFLGPQQVRSLGGMEACMRAPVWRARAVAGGVLLQLMEGEFDPRNSEHLRAQSSAMEYFGL